MSKLSESQYMKDIIKALRTAQQALDDISDFRNPSKEMTAAQYFLEIRGIARKARAKVEKLLDR